MQIFLQLPIRSQSLLIVMMFVQVRAAEWLALLFLLTWMVNFRVLLLAFFSLTNERVDQETQTDQENENRRRQARNSDNDTEDDQ